MNQGKLLFIVLVLFVGLAFFLLPDFFGGLFGSNHSGGSFVSVSLFEPADGFLTSSEGGISFSYVVVGSASSYSCNLFLNDSLRDSSGGVLNNTLSYFNLSNPGLGEWEWKVVCYSSPSSFNSSEVRTIIIQSEVLPSSTSSTSLPTTSWSTTSTMAPGLGNALYLRFDESSGNTAADSSGFGYTGSLVNGPVWVSGESGNALKFDGINDYVSMGEILDIYDQITISAWIKPDAVGKEQDIVC